MFFFCGSEFVLAVVFRREKQPDCRRVWRRASKYLAIVLGLIGGGIILQAHLWWLTENKNVEAVVSAVVATAFLFFFLYLLRVFIVYRVIEIASSLYAPKIFWAIAPRNNFDI